MQTATKRIGAIFAAACLLAALAFGGFSAWATDSAMGGSDSLTVKTTADENDDVNNANVVVNLYKIASATKNGAYDTYDYTFAEAYADLESKYPLNEMSGSLWQAMADDAVKIVGDTEPDVKAVPVGEAITGLTDGLYLVVTPNANSATYEYSFNPTIVALPTKEPLKDDNGNVVVDEDGFPIIRTSPEFGDWITSAEITLKWSKEPLEGSIKIVKKVTSFAGSPAVFEFKIDGTKPDGTAYGNVARVEVSSDKGGETVITGIPAGTKLTVKEVYSGGYKLVEGDDAEKVVIADAVVEAGEEQMITFEYTNEPVVPVESYGVENNFELTEEKSDWVWTLVPETAADADQS